ncbi:S100P-binding protein isoform X1 [Bombina bombina]|uniref:S100P-binding protein isoform X1 n=1 Tax=Bombina bombina TaxID=8345 RepID=UPI00235AC3AE|nr:S100P-binding protein isoform X1 [Bombina bombina]XP_053563250.1 S100P-binding protein isoform X1 [Bombina bombina]
MKNFSDHPCQPSLISNKNRKVNWGVSHLDTMEDIRISIVNDRVPGTKRARDQTEAQSPCPKRCRNVFICSTPCSASYSQAEGNLKNCLLLSPTSAELTDELDDSLLEPSGEEGDSPLHLTQEQIDELLEDDGCYAAESSTLDSTAEVQGNLVSQHIQSPGLQTTVSNAIALSPLYSSISAEELDDTLGESDTSICTLRALSVCKSEQDSTLNCGSGETSTTCWIPAVSGSRTDLSPPSHNTPDIHITSTKCSDLENVDKWSEGSDLPFDCDIDDILLLSPKITDSEEDSISNGVSTPVTVPINSTLNILLQPVAIQKSPTLPECTLPPSVSNHMPPDSFELSTPSSVICPRPHLNTAPESSDIAKQEKEPTTAVSESSDKKGGGSSVPLTCKTSSQKSKKQLPPQMVAPVWCNKTSPTFAQGKKLGTVTPLPRPVSRVSFSSYDLVEKKNQYINRVMMHLDGPNTSEDPHYQLASLLNQISRENPNWQHPADFTRRNHPRYRRKEFGRCSLHEWVTMNGGPNQRFKGLPHTFQRSPVPEESPFEPL